MKNAPKEQNDKNKDLLSFEKAKEKYLQFKNHADYNGLEPEITDYVAALEQANQELIEFFLHLYVNYEMPYGTMDIKTKLKFKYLMSKYRKRMI